MPATSTPSSADPTQTMLPAPAEQTQTAAAEEKANPTLISAEMFKSLPERHQQLLLAAGYVMPPEVKAEGKAPEEKAKAKPKEDKKSAPEEKDAGRHDIQNLLFWIKEKSTILETIKNKLHFAFLKSIFSLSLRNADAHVVGVNIPEIPDLIHSPYKNIRLSEHRGIKTPSGKLLDVLYYHGDGETKDDKRTIERGKIAENNHAWVADKQALALAGGDGSGDRLLIGDTNISVVIFDKQQQCLVWNPKFIEFLETAFPDGIYGLAIPRSAIFAPRGFQDADGDYVINFGNNQAEKEGDPVYKAKPVIVHTRTDKNGKSIAKVDLKALANTPINLSIEDFQNTTTLEDQTPAEYVVHNMDILARANISVIGFKAFNDPRKCFKPEVINSVDGSVNINVVYRNQFCNTKLAHLLNQHLGLEITTKKATAEFAKQFKSRLRDLLQAEETTNAELARLGAQPIPEAQTVRFLLKQAIREWLNSPEYAASANDLLKPPKILSFYDPKLNSWQREKLINEEALDTLVFNLLKQEDGVPNCDFKEFLRLFDVEWTGGYCFRKMEGLTNPKVDAVHGRSAKKKLEKSLKGKTNTLVFGGDAQDRRAGKIQAALQYSSEGGLLPTVLCFTLAENDNSKKFTGTPEAWLKQDAAKWDSQENEFLVSFKGEIYYVNRADTGLVVHITKPTGSDKASKDNLELYEKLGKKFIAADKKNDSFELDVKADKKILDLLDKIYGVRILTSKDAAYHDNFAEEVGASKDEPSLINPLMMFSKLFARGSTKSSETQKQSEVREEPTPVTISLTAS